MDIYALGQACNEFCDISDDRARSRDPFRRWLSQYRHDGVYALTCYATRVDDGYMSLGSGEKVNWIPGDGVFHGYPSERPGGARNYRYIVPMDAYLPNVLHDS